MLKTGKIDYVAYRKASEDDNSYVMVVKFTHMINELRGKGLKDPIAVDVKHVLYSNYGPMWGGIGNGHDWRSNDKAILYLPGTHRDRDEDEIEIPDKYWNGFANLIIELNSTYRDSYKSGRYIQPGVQVGPDEYQLVDADYRDMEMRVMAQLHDNHSMSVIVQPLRAPEFIDLHLVLDEEPRPLTEVLRART